MFELGLPKRISEGEVSSVINDDMETSCLQIVTALSNAVEAKDEYTRGHSERVARLSDSIAEECNLGRQERKYMLFASILHDVGKIGIGRDILLKRCKLEPREEKELRTHPEKGVRILEPVSFLNPILPAILHHHERFDGSGYPDGLEGKEIPFKARILSITDAWDAMLSTRPYRKAVPFETARAEILSCAGSHFDPELVAIFEKIIERDLS
jgi:HD-GYP domain-containing protein (c-di-GMP phosphodiesterase class II)